MAERQVITVRQALTEAIGLSEDAITRSDEQRMERIFEHFGYQRRMGWFRGRYGEVWVTGEEAARLDARSA